jgi:benzoyl-CoA reductase subunit C
MTTTRHILDRCRHLVRDPEFRRAYLEEIRPRCRGIVGCFSNYIPEEILAAAGFHPLRVIGALTASVPPRRLFNPVCSFAQDAYAAACTGEFSVMSRIVFPNSCDSLKVLYQVWSGNTQLPPAVALLHPVSAAADAVSYFARRLREFSARMQREPGRRFTDDDLISTIKQYNQIRSLLRQLYALRKHSGSCLSGADAVALMTAGLMMDRNEYRTIVRQVIDDVQRKVCTDAPSKRMMLIGPLVDNIALLDAIESLGACIVYEDITNGARYCDGDVSVEGDVYENLARRYLTAGPSPTLVGDIENEEHKFSQRVAELEVDGVICINQKFCEPHVHNYLSKADILRQMNINVLMIEVEHNHSDISQRDVLRIESFVEVAKRH